MSSKILKVIFFLLVAGVLLYVIRSGIIGASERALTSNSSSTTSSTNTGGFFGFLHLLQASSATPPSSQSYISQNQSSGSGSGSATTTSTINPAEIPAGFTAAELSPYFQEVHLSDISYGGGYGSYGQIELYANFPPSSTIDITNWQIKTKDGGEYIPQAINLYQPYGVSPNTDIMLHAGDQVYLYSSPGPFNLRLNECIGYIAKDNPTNPQIPQLCPSVDRSQIQNFTGACQNYIDTISDCQTPDLNNPQIPFNDYACRDYISNNFNYGSCFTAHDSDPNFLSNQIYVWTGSNVLDAYHDQVELLDRNGLVVDVYSY